MYSMDTNLFPQQAMIVNQDMVDQTFPENKGERFLALLKDNKVLDYWATLFTLYDYYDADGNFIFSPKQAIDAMKTIVSESVIEENRIELMEACKFFVKQRRSSKEKR